MDHLVVRQEFVQQLLHGQFHVHEDEAGVQHGDLGHGHSHQTSDV